MSARSSSKRWTAASSAGASPTSRFSASTGRKPASSCSRRAAEYFAAQPPQEARSVSLTLAASRSMGRSLPVPRNCRDSVSLSSTDVSAVRVIPTPRRSNPNCQLSPQHVRPGEWPLNKRRRPKPPPCQGRGGADPRKPERLSAGNCLLNSLRALRALLDRHVDEIAPLRPGTVVVLDGRVTEQLSQDEPGVSAALADPAVRRHLFLGRHAFALVKLA